MIRWLMTKWRGPLCDAGTAHGQTGCLRAAVEFHAILPGHTRGLRWCRAHGTVVKRWQVAGLVAPEHRLHGAGAPAGKEDGK